MSVRRDSRSWRERQEKDPYVQAARRAGWRSRAVFKLEEICRRERLLKKGMTCVDLGAAPGGWSQYVTETLGGDARLVAVDLLAMDALPGVEFVLGDFTEDAVLDEILETLGGAKADLVMSDMAPNMSGTRSVDQPRAMYLAELALDFCGQVLRTGGDFVCKLFHGEGFDAFVAAARQAFGTVRVIKPKASRAGSREVYLVARNYRL